MRLEPATAHGDHAEGALQAQICHLRVVTGMRFASFMMEVAGVFFYVGSTRLGCLTPGLVRFRRAKKK
jgi:hypothetical protein